MKTPKRTLSQWQFNINQTKPYKIDKKREKGMKSKWWPLWLR